MRDRFRVWLTGPGRGGRAPWFAPGSPAPASAAPAVMVIPRPGPDRRGKAAPRGGRAVQLAV